MIFNPLPDIRAEVTAGKLGDIGGGLGAEIRIGDGLTAEADQVEIGREQTVDGQVIKRR